MKKTITTIALLALLPACHVVSEEDMKREAVIEYRIESNEVYKYQDGTIEVEKHLYMKKNPRIQNM